MKASPASSSVRSHDRSSIAGNDGKVGRTMGAFTVDVTFAPAGGSVEGAGA